MLLLLRIVLIAISAILTLLVCHIVSNGTLLQVLQFVTPTMIQNGVCMLFPIQEIYQAYDIINQFVPTKLLNEDIARLFFITFHIQIGIGYIGIDFLKKEQERRNQLVRMDISTGSDDDDSENENDETTSPSTTTIDAPIRTVRLKIKGCNNRLDDFNVLQHRSFSLRPYRT